MISEFKSDLSRLIRFFEQSRDNWKEKAINRHKKIRALEIKIRDLSLSREQWKSRAIEAEKQLQILCANQDKGQKKGN